MSSRRRWRRFIGRVIDPPPPPPRRGAPLYVRIHSNARVFLLLLLYCYIFVYYCVLITIIHRRIASFVPRRGRRRAATGEKKFSECARAHLQPPVGPRTGRAVEIMVPFGDPSAAAPVGKTTDCLFSNFLSSVVVFNGRLHRRVTHVTDTAHVTYVYNTPV